MEFKFTNVNDAFIGIVQAFRSGRNTVRTPSRAGDVIQIAEPVLVTYEKPLQRVLFHESRDANPFFHLFESLWMLAGRNDVAPLAFYSSGIADIASDDGKTFNGAYGYRWRKAYGVYEIDGYNQLEEVHRVDQLNVIIDHLRQKPQSRRAVLQMWNVEDDLLKIDVTKDVCCNTAVYFSIRQTDNPMTPATGAETREELRSFGRDIPFDNTYLDMTVTNRSNDAIWGMLGANVVHFSFLQEYIANSLGVEVGKYYQFTNNLHVYESNWKPEVWLYEFNTRFLSHPSSYPDSNIPLVKDRKAFDWEIGQFIDNHDRLHNPALKFDEPLYTEPFLEHVARPMCVAFEAHKAGQDERVDIALDGVMAPDWRQVGRDWIYRRRAARKVKRATRSSGDGG